MMYCPFVYIFEYSIPKLQIDVLVLVVFLKCMYICLVININKNSLPPQLKSSDDLNHAFYYLPTP